MQYVLTQEELDELKAPAQEDCSVQRQVTKAVLGCKEARVVTNVAFGDTLIHVVLRVEELPDEILKLLEMKAKGLR